MEISQAFQKAGGFGKYQVLSFILLAAARNYGQFPIYGFAFVGLMPETAIVEDNQIYECWSKQKNDWTNCTRESICSGESDPFLRGTRIRNWHHQLKLMCDYGSRQELEVAMEETISFYMIGYFLGMILFPIPDIYGRKTPLIVTLILTIIGQILTVYGTSLQIKSIGIFIQGFLHIKNNLCFITLFEVV